MIHFATGDDGSRSRIIKVSLPLTCGSMKNTMNTLRRRDNQRRNGVIIIINARNRSFNNNSHSFHWEWEWELQLERANLPNSSYWTSYHGTYLEFSLVLCKRAPGLIHFVPSSRPLHVGRSQLATREPATSLGGILSWRAALSHERIIMMIITTLEIPFCSFFFSVFVVMC